MISVKRILWVALALSMAALMTAPLVAAKGGKGGKRGGAAATTETSPLGAMKDADTDFDGSISKEELKAFFEKEFSKYDTNSDGKLSADELKAMMQTLAPQTAQETPSKKDKKRGA